MKFLPILFFLVLFLSVASYAQSQEKKGCGKESECIVKTCEDDGAEVKAHVKGESNQKQTATQQNKPQNSDQQATGAKSTQVRKVEKKK
jgi:hypothetical protein